MPRYHRLDVLVQFRTGGDIGEIRCKVGENLLFVVLIHFKALQILHNIPCSLWLWYYAIGLWGKSQFFLPKEL